MPATSRLAQSVERQTLNRVSSETKSYLNVVGSSPTLGALFCQPIFNDCGSVHMTILNDAWLNFFLGWTLIYTRYEHWRWHG